MLKNYFSLESFNFFYGLLLKCSLSFSEKIASFLGGHYPITIEKIQYKSFKNQKSGLIRVFSVLKCISVFGEVVTCTDQDFGLLKDELRSVFWILY